MSQHSSSYSYDSLNDVFNIANRKGKMQKKYLSKEYLDAAQEYREMRKELNDILRKKKELRTESELTRIDVLKVEMSENAKKQKTLLQKHLTTVSSNILSGIFRFTLTPDTSKDPLKPLYVLGNTPEEYFAMQALCRNVKRLFKISMAGRDEIISQLKMLLKEDKHRYYIIRTDVQHCFESIPHEQLFWYLENNSLLDVKSKSLLHGLIKKEFEAKNLRPVVKTPNTGVPRGCAISSLLAEFYLSSRKREIGDNNLTSTDMPISASIIPAGCVVEFYDKVTIFQGSQTTEIEHEPTMRVRSFMNSIRYRNIIATVKMNDISLHSVAPFGTYKFVPQEKQLQPGMLFDARINTFEEELPF